MINRSIKVVSQDYCGTFYAARLLGLSVGTIQSLVEKGDLEGWRTKGGHRRITLSSIQAYQVSHGLTSKSTPGSPCIKILVVDDDIIAREFMMNLIEKWKLPVDCTVMASAMEALIDIHGLKPDILFTDLNMPGVDGLELLRTLRGNPSFESMVMVAITGLDTEEIQARGGVPVNTVIVEKPVNTAWLKGFVTALVTRRLMISGV